MTFLRTKFPFSRPKFLMTFFRFSISLPFVKCHYMTHSSREKTLFQKKFLDDIFFFNRFVLSRASYFSKYWRTDAWAVIPSQILWGRPPVPSKSPPMFSRHQFVMGRTWLPRSDH